jgi:hypothetical protein
MRKVLLTLLLLPSLASAQVIYVAPPPVPPPVPFAPPAPPVYVPAPPPLGSVPPHVYIRERIRWHLRRHLPRVVIVAPPPPAIVVEPAPPPVVVAPPPPTVYVEPMPAVPPPIVAPAPRVYVYTPPPPPAPVELVVQKAKPVAQWTSKIGLGVRGSGQVINNGWDNLGIGGELLYRASPHLVTELAAEYQRSPDGPLDRTDIPITLGLRLHIGRPNWVVSPYFVVAAGIDIALQDLKFTDDTAYYFDAQLGGGLELRLGQHVAITADARFDGKKRLNDPDTAVAQTRSINGKAFHALDDEYGGQFRLGVAAYF